MLGFAVGVAVVDVVVSVVGVVVAVVEDPCFCRRTSLVVVEEGALFLPREDP